MSDSKKVKQMDDKNDDELGLTIIDNASDRIKRIRQRYLEEKTVISIERARYYTESWKETEGYPIGVRVALAMKNVIKKMNFNVDPDDRIAGTWTEHFLGTPIDIERGLFNQVFAVELDKKKMKRFNLKGNLHFAFWKIQKDGLISLYKSLKHSKKIGTTIPGMGTLTMDKRKVNWNRS